MHLNQDSPVEIILTNENPILEFAAAQLETYLSMAFSRAPELYVRSHERRETRVPDSAFRIVLNGGKPAPFADDEFVIEVSEDRLLIDSASPRGVLYGVYDFLEQYVGVFWDKPGSERVPRHTSITLEPDRRAVKPRLPFRGFYLDSSAKSMNSENTVALIDWMAKKRANYLLVSVNFFEDLREAIVPELKRRGIVLEVGHHGFVNFVDPAEHLEKLPEWFSLVNGERTGGFRRNNMTHDSQLCSSSEEGLSFYADRLADYLKKYPEIDVIGIIPNDGRGWCECDRCLALEESAPGNLLVAEDAPDYDLMHASGRYHRIVSVVANRLNDVHRDAVGARRISFWAYHSTIMPSEFVKEFPDNTILSGFALFERCYSHSLGDQACDSYPVHLNGKYREIIKRWDEVYDAPKLIYEYYRKYMWLTKPKVMPELLREDMAFLDEAGLAGVNSMCEMDAWPIYEINQHGYLDYSWHDRQQPGDAYIEAFARKKLPEQADVMIPVLQEVQAIMAPFGMLGGRYPHEKIDDAIARLGRCVEMLDSGLDRSVDPTEKSYLGAWRQNLIYMQKAFLSDKQVLDTLSSEQIDERALNAILDRDRELEEYTETMNSESFLHSEYVTNRIGRRRRRIEELRDSGSSASRKELHEIWIAGWF